MSKQKTEKFKLPVATLSYPHLAEPDTKFNPDNDKRDCTLLFEEDADLSVLEDAIKQAAGKKKIDMSKIIGVDDEGRRKVKPRSKFEIGCYNKQKQRISKDMIEEVFYAGCKVIANVSVYAHSFGVSVGLSDILFVDDGERLGGGGSPFGDVEEEEVF